MDFEIKQAIKKAIKDVIKTTIKRDGMTAYSMKEAVEVIELLLELDDEYDLEKLIELFNKHGYGSHDKLKQIVYDVFEKELESKKKKRG